MRVDIHNPSLDHAVFEYEVKSTPKIVVFENFKIVVEEAISIDTYNKIKEKIYKKPSSTSTAASSSQATPQTPAQQTTSAAVKQPSAETTKSGGVSIGDENTSQNTAPSQIYQQSISKNSVAESE